MMFRVGQKVVCIKCDAWAGSPQFGDECFPAFRGVYTVRTVERFGGVAYITLQEIVNQLHDYTGDGFFDRMLFPDYRFRPIVERKTDISVFTKMLRPTDATVDA